MASILISPIGYVHSTLKQRSDAPRQGWEGAPDARLEIDPAFIECLDGIGRARTFGFSRGSMKRNARFSRYTREAMR